MPYEQAAEPVPYRGGYLQLVVISGTPYVIALDEDKREHLGPFVLKILPNGKVKFISDVNAGDMLVRNKDKKHRVRFSHEA